MWSSLPEELRSARHLQTIAMRNITSHQSNIITINNTHKYYAQYKDTRNPTWNLDPPININSTVISIQHADVNINMQLETLNKIPHEIIKSAKQLPANFFYVVVDGEFYTNIPIENISSNFPLKTSKITEIQTTPVSSDNFKKISLTSLITELINHAKVVLEQKSCKKEIHSICSKLGDHVEQFQKKSANCVRIEKVQRLEEYADLQLKCLKEDLECVKEVRKRLFKKAEELLHISAFYQYHNKDLQNLEEKKSSLNNEYDREFSRLARRRQHIMKKARKIYPIQAMSDNPDILTICGQSLSNLDDEESFSTALGYISHVMILICKYYNIHPGRYVPVFFSSKSRLFDESTGKIIPLFARVGSADAKSMDRAFACVFSQLHSLCGRLGVHVPWPHSSARIDGNMILRVLSGCMDWICDGKQQFM